MTRKRIKEHCAPNVVYQVAFFKTCLRGLFPVIWCPREQFKMSRQPTLGKFGFKKPMNTEVGIELIVLLDHAFAVIYAAHLTTN